MKTLLCLLLVAGCSNVEYSHKNVSTIAQSMDAFYFSDVFLNAPEVDVEQQTRKLHNGTVIFNEKETQKFLKKLRKMYSRM